MFQFYVKSSFGPNESVWRDSCKSFKHCETLIGISASCFAQTRNWMFNNNNNNNNNNNIQYFVSNVNVRFRPYSPL